MGEELDADTKLGVYRLVINRYIDVINEKESPTISEMREKVKPYIDFTRRIRDDILKDMHPYEYKFQFFTAAQRAVSYIRNIRTIEFAFNFWIGFEDMDRLRIGTTLDKAVLLTSVLRSLGSEDVVIIVTRKGRPYVKFSFDGKTYLFVPDSGSMLLGDDSLNIFKDDPAAYSFSDLVYENYDES